MDLQTTSFPGAPAFVAPAPADAFLELPLEDLEVRPARSAADVAAIGELRREIDLAAAMAADPLFLHHEKKEMSWGCRSPSRWATGSSAP